jgi:hypothetical protein
MIEYHTNNASPFYGVFILDSNSGVELISHSYIPSRIDLDVNAISGMFKALELFVNNMAYSNQFETVQEINFQGTRFVYERYGPPHRQILCVGVSRKMISLKKEHHVLKAIVRDFYETFRPSLQNFQGEVKNFEQFHPVLEEISRYFQESLSIHNPTLSTPRFSPLRTQNIHELSRIQRVAGSDMPTSYLDPSKPQSWGS